MLWTLSPRPSFILCWHRPHLWGPLDHWGWPPAPNGLCFLCILCIINGIFTDFLSFFKLWLNKCLLLIWKKNKVFKIITSFLDISIALFLALYYFQNFVYILIFLTKWKAKYPKTNYCCSFLFPVSLKYYHYHNQVNVSFCGFPILLTVQSTYT